MPILSIDRIKRSFVKANPTCLFVFGDNVKRIGMGGQAKECRGEPNAIGIPTKWYPSMEESSFFTDSCLDTVKPILDKEFDRLKRHLDNGGTVYVPTDGVGTGLAQLPTRAPKIYEYICEQFTYLLK